jgi:hypothetical protein
VGSSENSDEFLYSRNSTANTEILARLGSKPKNGLRTNP